MKPATPPSKPYLPFQVHSGPLGWEFRFQDSRGVIYSNPDQKGYETEYEATKAMRRFCITRGENPNVPWPYNQTVAEIHLDLEAA